MTIDEVAWWIWPVAAVGLLAYLSLRLSRPRYFRGVQLDELRSHVSRFVAHAIDQGVLVMELEDGLGLLQLTLHDEGASARSVELGLPLVTWSEEAFRSIKRSLEARGYATGTQGGRRCATVREFLRARASGEVEKLIDAACDMIAISVDELGWSEDCRFTVHAETPFSCREWVRRRSAHEVGER